MDNAPSPNVIDFYEKWYDHHFPKMSFGLSKRMARLRRQQQEKRNRERVVVELKAYRSAGQVLSLGNDGDADD